MKDSIIKGKKLKNTVVAVGCISMLVIILFSPLNFYLYKFSFYNSLYEKNNVYSVIDREDAKKLTSQVFEFFSSNTPFEEFTLKSRFKYFTENEINHLDDVRILLDRIKIVFWISVAAAILCTAVLYEKKYLFYLKNILKIFIISSAAMAGLMLILYFFGSNFSSLFERFHYIFFPQGNWAFSADALLINIFPFGFFYDFFYRLLTASFAVAVILLVLSAAATALINFFLKKERLKRAGK